MTAARRTSSGLAVERAGEREGTAVVLLHAGVADRRMWDPVWPPLTATHDAIRYDLRGFGESDQLPDGPLDHTADLIGLLDELDVDACHLVGSSFGAGVAVEVAVTHPGRVRSLLLCPPGGSLLEEMTPHLRAFVDAEESAFATGDLDAAVEANVTAWVVGAGRTATDVDDEVIASVRAMQRRAFEIAQRWGDVDTVELDPPPTERFGELTAPTLVLVGTHDMDTVLDAAERLASEVDGARSLTWSDVAHLPALERPARFVQVLDDWLAQSSGART